MLKNSISQKRLGEINSELQVMQKLHGLTSVQDRKSGDTIMTRCSSYKVDFSSKQKKKPFQMKCYLRMNIKRKCCNRDRKIL
jgi:hypothetical protein